MSQQAPARRPGGPLGGGAPMGMGMGVSDAKAQDFRGSIARFSTRLRPERWLIVLVLVLASTSVFLAVLGPKLLGNATNIIFDGVVGKQIPAGLTQDQAVAALEASGSTDQAQMLAAMTVTPGQGVDFTALAQVLALVVVVYVLSSVLSWAQNYLMAGVTQRTMYRLREDIDTKLGRLPLRYFDSVSRGDVLSRVTNDIDNIANTLQQTLTQLITSVLTVIGVLAMMFWISPLLAVISLLTVPLSFWVTMLIAKRSQPHFVAQWKWTGRAQRPCRGDVHRPRPGQGVRPSARVDRPVRRRQRAHVREQLQGSVHLGHHPAGHHGRRRTSTTWPSP